MGVDVDRRRAFEAVTDVVYEPLDRYLRRRSRPEDASELLNDVLLVIWRRLDDVPTDNPLPWSYGIARNCLSNQRRGSRRRLPLADRLVAHQPEPPTFDPTAESVDLVHHDADTPLARALRDLESDDREIIRLWAWEQLEAREIALVLGTTANAVSSRLTRLKKRLASSIERQSQPGAGHRTGRHTKEPRS